MPGQFQRIERITQRIEECDFWLLLVRQCKRLAGGVRLPPDHFAPCDLLENGQYSLAKNGLLHDDHHMEWVFNHALFAGTNSTLLVPPHLLPDWFGEEYKEASAHALSFALALLDVARF